MCTNELSSFMHYLAKEGTFGKIKIGIICLLPSNKELNKSIKIPILKILLFPLNKYICGYSSHLKQNKTLFIKILNSSLFLNATNNILRSNH